MQSLSFDDVTEIYCPKSDYTSKREISDYISGAKKLINTSVSSANLEENDYLDTCAINDVLEDMAHALMLVDSINQSGCFSCPIKICISHE